MDPSLWKINETNASDFATGLRISRVSQQPDSFVFNVDGQPFDSAALYAYGEALSLYKGDDRWFEGVVVSGPRFGSASIEAHDYEIAGLWWFLEQTSFMQDWRAGTGVGTINKNHVILGRDIDNNIISVGEVIAEVLDHAILFGAPFAYDVTELDLLSAKPPTDEPTGLTHGEVIRKMLRWYPDCVTWFDYSAETPVLHFTRRVDATAVQYDCTDGFSAEEINIRDRSDLMKSGVIVNYERTDTIDGERIPTLQQDVYPPGVFPGFDVASLTINLQGSQLATQSTEVVVAAGHSATVIEAEIKKHHPQLAGATFEDGATRLGDGVRLDNVLLKGPVPSWTGQTSGQCEFLAKATYTDDVGSVHTKEDVSVIATLTSAETHRYTKEISYTEADPYPEGLASALADALGVKHYEGMFQTVETECTGSIHPGKVLNLIGGVSEWATMRAVVQRVDFDLDKGRTSITFGPPKHLGVQDHIALLNANRNRTTHYSGDARKTGKAGGGEDLDTGGTTPNSSGSSTPRYSRQVIDNGVDPAEDPGGVKKIILDANSIGAGKMLVGDASGNSMVVDFPRWV